MSRILDHYATVTGNRLGPEATREKRRSERVKLSVPVIVMTETLEHEQAQEVTHTITVNAHGGLFKLKMELLAGQPMISHEYENQREQRCRVVRVEQLPAAWSLELLLNLRLPAPEFWSVELPPRRLESSSVGVLIS